MRKVVEENAHALPDDDRSAIVGDDRSSASFQKKALADLSSNPAGDRDSFGRLLARQLLKYRATTRVDHAYIKDLSEAFVSAYPHVAWTLLQSMLFDSDLPWCPWAVWPRQIQLMVGCIASGVPKVIDRCKAPCRHKIGSSVLQRTTARCVCPVAEILRCKKPTLWCDSWLQTFWCWQVPASPWILRIALKYLANASRSSFMSW